MFIIKYLLAVTAGALFGAFLNHKKEVEKTDAAIRNTREAVWSEAFQKGWTRSQEHYTRYYDEKTWKLAFGTDRPW